MLHNKKGTFDNITKNMQNIIKKMYIEQREKAIFKALNLYTLVCVVLVTGGLLWAIVTTIINVSYLITL